MWSGHVLPSLISGTHLQRSVAFLSDWSEIGDDAVHDDDDNENDDVDDDDVDDDDVCLHVWVWEREI